MTQILLPKKYIEQIGHTDNLIHLRGESPCYAVVTLFWNPTGKKILLFKIE